MKTKLNSLSPLEGEYIVKMVSGQPKPPQTLMRLVHGYMVQITMTKELSNENPKLKLGSLPHTSQLARDKGNINDDTHASHFKLL
jgi:hypothetical protein